MFKKAVLAERAVSRLVRADRHRQGVVCAVIDGLMAGMLEDVQEASVMLLDRASRPESLGFSSGWLAGAVNYCYDQADWSRQKANDLSVDAILTARAVGRLREKVSRNNGVVSELDKTRLNDALRIAERASRKVEYRRNVALGYERAAAVFAAASVCVGLGLRASLA